ncbi:MAG: glycoside hydrolase family 5 protein, partial [Acidimicrobiia bacterium]|nr:glycoside hydrolase family 5 protein [Acidimicrobiia bacterium]
MVNLHGVNRSGTEYACIQGWGIFDGPSDAASVQAIASWHTNIVRVPLNEDCWLGINGVNPAYGGTAYRQAIVSYVNLLHQYGMYAELSLIWGAPGSYQATYQPGGPDADHSPSMWSSLAGTFKGDPNVILAPWGETITGWTCFMQTGCNNEATYGPSNAGYQTAPMQQAVTLMRQAGYHGVIAIPCIDYANACGTLPDGSNYNGSTWLASRP